MALHEFIVVAVFVLATFGLLFWELLSSPFRSDRWPDRNDIEAREAFRKQLLNIPDE